MRILHTSDWHLGHELHGFDRAFEHERFLEWLLEQLSTQNADVLLVAGDVYDTANPPTHAQERFYRFLSRALDACQTLQIIVVGGNHDSAARVELPRPLLDKTRVRLIGGMPRRDGAIDPAGTLIPLRNGDGEWVASCAAVPYLRPGDLPVASSQGAGLRARYAEIIATAHAHAAGRPLVVTGHLHLSGCAVSELSERRIVVGGEEAVAADLFDKRVAYVALGHLHRPQLVPGPTVIRYSGSPFPMSVAERDYEHSVVLCDIAADGTVTTRCLTIPRPVAFVRVPPIGSLSLPEVEEQLQGLPDDILEPERPFLEVAVEVDGSEPDLRQRIEAALAGKPYRLTRILRSTCGAGGVLADRAAAAELDELDPAAVFDELHRTTFGSDASNELKRAFASLLVEVQAGADSEEVQA